MPSPSTALQLMTDALALTNAVGIDQTLTAQETTDGLRKFNDMLDSWSLDNLAVYGQANQSFNTVAGQATYTIGPAGNWNTTRPVRINSPAYTTINGVTFPCVAIDQESYNLIAVKAQPQPYAQVYLYVNAEPLGLVTLWPVPNAVYPMTFSIDRVLTQAATAATVLTFPPGYAHAFVTNLAVLLGPIFGKQMSKYPEVVSEAKLSLGRIKRANQTPIRSRYDPALRPDGYVDWRKGYWY